MKDAQSEPAYGRTHWRRFAVVVAVPTAAAGALVFGLANGAFAASFAIAGQPFKISADKLDGTGFSQYGGKQQTAKEGDQDVPVAISGIREAKLYNLCQSVRAPGSPISLTIRAGRDDTPAVATNLLIGMSQLDGNAEFTGINIGQDASTLGQGGPDAHGEVGAFGQEASGVVITNLKQTAVSTTAGTFTLPGLTLKINLPDKDGNPAECF